MKTGNTPPSPPPHGEPDAASMEPGHEDREYGELGQFRLRIGLPQWSPVMKTGNTFPRCSAETVLLCLNGARS